MSEERFVRKGRAVPSTVHRVGAGTCCWCARPILPGQRKDPARASWHHECLAELALLKDREVQRFHLLHRSRGYCEGCGVQVATCEARRRVTVWDVDEPSIRRNGVVASGPVSWIRMEWRFDFLIDHVRPLWSLPAALTREEVRHFWGPSNLQALCLDCHREKTATEAAERARSKRAA